MGRGTAMLDWVQATHLGGVLFRDFHWRFEKSELLRKRRHLEHWTGFGNWVNGCEDGACDSTEEDEEGGEARVSDCRAEHLQWVSRKRTRADNFSIRIFWFTTCDHTWGLRSSFIVSRSLAQIPRRCLVFFAFPFDKAGIVNLHLSIMVSRRIMQRSGLVWYWRAYSTWSKKRLM